MAVFADNKAKTALVFGDVPHASGKLKLQGGSHFMNQIDLKACYDAAVHIVSSDVLSYMDYSGYFTRKRKLAPEKLISFFVSQGASATQNELIDFYGLDCQAPSASALNQQRASLGGINL